MINKIKIHNVATYTKPVEIDPKKINFIYGSNGSGKTTISNLLSGHLTSNDCCVSRNNPNDIEILVYNKKFVEDNFKQSTSVKGIFTLGEKAVVEKDTLERLKTENKNHLQNITTKSNTIEGYEEKIKREVERFVEDCWKIQISLGTRFKKALVGYRNSKQKFYEECLSSYEAWDKKTIVIIEDLSSKYDSAFSEIPQVYSTFSTFDIEESSTHESSSLLQKVITGSADSPFGNLVDVLKNSDWLKEGLTYIDNSQDKCPFCQQEISENLQLEIRNYFDEEYEKDCQALNNVIEGYRNYYFNVLKSIKAILETAVPFIDTSKLESEYQLLNSSFEMNMKELEKKRSSPSNKTSLKSVKEQLEGINQIIEDFNDLIISNNEIVNNKEKEQKNCIESLWKYIVQEKVADIKDHLDYIKGNKKAIASISEQKSELESKIEKNQRKIVEIEKPLTNIHATVENINKILEKFDFSGFKIKENEKDKRSYKIVRNDGTDVEDTLSEGEYNFITFLYFYYLVYGSQEETGTTKSKIVVIDDPISSLDSNVLFIVSSLVKKVLKDCREKKEGILQVFVLTHNVYFHKEVTFLGSRQTFSPKEVVFGVMRKKEDTSYFEKYDKNPIESSYQLLWRELSQDKLSPVSSFNTMRRILEYYFKIIGDLNYEECIEKFDGNDKIICKSLVACINDGSHFISEDFVVTFDSENFNNHKRIFQQIFKELGHEPHYDMMMKPIK